MKQNCYSSKTAMFSEILTLWADCAAIPRGPP